MAKHGSTTNGRASTSTPEAVGWDWTGINLDDGGALMVFRIRAAGAATRFAGGTLAMRPAGPRSHAVRYATCSHPPVDVSPHRRRLSGGMACAPGEREFELEPLMDNQEKMRGCRRERSTGKERSARSSPVGSWAEDISNSPVTGSGFG